MLTSYFRRYASEVDIDFVRKAVRSIGRLAIKVESAADMCIDALLELIDTKVTYVVQEAIIVTKDIFRRYPGRYEGIIPKLCENIDALDEPEAKAAIIWIIGQFADKIENSDELLDDLVFTFLEETTEVQLALLTAVVKLFIFKPNSTTAKDVVHSVVSRRKSCVRRRITHYSRGVALSPLLSMHSTSLRNPQSPNGLEKSGGLKRTDFCWHPP